MPIPERFIALTSHAAPGLHFPAHPEAKTSARIVPCPHHLGPPASEAAIKKLKLLTAACPPAQRELEEFYRRWNGAALCCVPHEDGPAPLLMLLPIEEWQGATDELATGDLGFLLEGLEEIFPPARFVVIGAAPSEETRLILSLAGTFDDKPTAGKVLYASMDPVLAVGEPVADSFMKLLDAFASDPAAFLEHISSTYFVETREGLWGDVADRYLADAKSRRANP